MEHREGNLTGARNLSVYYQYWQPDTPARAVLLVVHGAGEHGGRYQRFAQHFTASGYAVAALDHPGHGRSEGTRVFVERFDDYLDTLRLFQQRVQADFPGLPVVLVGHSLGGLISCHYLLRHQDELAGCVLSGAAIMTELEPGWLQTLTIRLLSSLLPRSGALALDPAGVSRDPEEVARYVADPLVNHGKMTARMVAELFAAMAQIQQRAPQIRLPLLVLHGGADSMTSPEGSRFLEREVASEDKTLRIYPGLYHEIFNEPEHEAVMRDVEQWCGRLLVA